MEITKEMAEMMCGLEECNLNDLPMVCFYTIFHNLVGLNENDITLTRRQYVQFLQMNDQTLPYDWHHTTHKFRGKKILIKE